MSDTSGKTEKPTPNRIKKARDEGSYAIGRHLPTAVALWCWWLVLLTMLPPLSLCLLHGVRWSLRRLAARTAASPGLDMTSFRQCVMVLYENAPALLIPLVALLVIQLLMTGFGLHSFKNVVGAKHLNPVKRVTNLLTNARRTLVEALIGISLLAGLLFFGFQNVLHASLIGSRHSLGSGLITALTKLKSFCAAALSICAFLAVLDYAFRRYSYSQSMRMSKQDLREENRDLNGHPEIKARIRRLRMSLARQRMFAAIPTATVVVTNPTHYAVALKYDAHAMACPVVVALGVDFLAVRIKQLAVRSRVPIVEHPPLAQALYRNCSVGQQIPSALYRAVAEILAFVLRSSSLAH
jgi:flagellar biosynthetic protein FlhB